MGTNESPAIVESTSIHIAIDSPNEPSQATNLHQKILMMKLIVMNLQRERAQSVLIILKLS